MKKELQQLIVTNLWYYIPVALWFVVGGMLLLVFSRDDLFLTINSYHTPAWDKAMSGFSGYGRGDIIPFILVPLAFLPVCRNKTFIISSLAFGALIPTFIFFAKEFFNKPRPILYYEGKYKVHSVSWLSDLTNNSFPSGHTLAVFGFFLLLSIVLPVKQKAWSLFFFLCAFLCGYSRMYLGQHFFQDVYAGSVCGIIFTSLIYAGVRHWVNQQAKKHE